MFAVTGPFLGWYTDHYSLGSAFVIAGLVILTGGIIILVPVFRNNS
jgi:hypothetical protein